MKDVFKKQKTKIAKFTSTEKLQSELVSFKLWLPTVVSLLGIFMKFL